MATITPRRIRTIAGQSGFRGLLVTDGNVVKSLLYVGKANILQEVGRVTDVQRLIDFCRQEDIEIQDERPDHIDEWRDDPWIGFGA